MNVTQVYNIARREYLARVRNKAFIFTTLLVPALIAGDRVEWKRKGCSTEMASS